MRLGVSSAVVSDNCLAKAQGLNGTYAQSLSCQGEGMRHPNMLLFQMSCSTNGAERQGVIVEPVETGPEDLFIDRHEAALVAFVPDLQVEK